MEPMRPLEARLSSTEYGGGIVIQGDFVYGEGWLMTLLFQGDKRYGEASPLVGVLQPVVVGVLLVVVVVW